VARFNSKINAKTVAFDCGNEAGSVCRHDRLFDCYSPGALRARFMCPLGKRSTDIQSGAEVTLHWSQHIECRVLSDFCVSRCFENKQMQVCLTCQHNILDISSIRVAYVEVVWKRVDLLYEYALII